MSPMLRQYRNQLHSESITQHYQKKLPSYNTLIYRNKGEFIRVRGDIL